MVARSHLVFLCTAAGMLGIAMWQDRPPVVPPIEALTGFQDADAPLLLPSDGQPRFRLHQFSAWQLVEIPAATRFESPLGSEHGALTCNDQKFWELNAERGGHHTGDDLNGIGGGNSDLGDPVFATADGLVSFVGEPSPGSGKTIIVAHRDREGRLLESMYAHLDRIDVVAGALVARGAKIGTVGTANGYYPAHLHFEMRRGDGIDVGSGYSMLPLNRLDPAKTIAELAGSAPDELSPSPLAAALK
ncbi:M23 family metallopeptidase [Luteolibacter arcticus]|uniref:M23 family metallopeptidase n=1 Tax=Luteolibacter arcticus TaxID=1581411 RepID=A0ABT3GFA6_9BACT|nr:M23 family metallopeptidase [Luteolibacter arcticus]MCW1921963.1 M23 family metallopeptidase [Luteolibacter arcticus]